jgi:YhcH/YjgK/YiaL family protein
MILDILENAHQYCGLGSGFEKAFDFLRRPDLKSLPAGEYDIDGEQIFAVVSRGPGRRKEDARLEIHRTYIDIQMILAGTDTMGWKPLVSCKTPAGSYDPERDLRFFDDAPDAWIDVAAGGFAIFFPEDAHMPMISSGQGHSEQIHKVVVKIAAGPPSESGE